MILRQATCADIPAMHQVRMAVRENRLAPTTVINAEDYAHAISTAGRGWVATVNDLVVGFAVGNSFDGNIWALFVLPECERRGYGRNLHDTMIAWLWTQKLTRLWLTTGRGTRAENFYRRAGWHECGNNEKGEIIFELLRSNDAI